MQEGARRGGIHPRRPGLAARRGGGGARRSDHGGNGEADNESRALFQRQGAAGDREGRLPEGAAGERSRRSNRRDFNVCLVEPLRVSHHFNVRARVRKYSYRNLLKKISRRFTKLEFEIGVFPAGVMTPRRRSPSRSDILNLSCHFSSSILLFRSSNVQSGLLDCSMHVVLSPFFVISKWPNYHSQAGLPPPLSSP